MVFMDEEPLLTTWIIVPGLKAHQYSRIKAKFQIGRSICIGNLHEPIPLMIDLLEWRPTLRSYIIWFTEFYLHTLQEDSRPGNKIQVIKVATLLRLTMDFRTRLLVKPYQFQVESNLFDIHSSSSTNSICIHLFSWRFAPLSIEHLVSSIKSFISICAFYRSKF